MTWLEPIDPPMVSTPSERLRIAAIFMVVLLPLFIQRSAAGGQNWNWAVSQGLAKERVIGLLNLPEIISPECAPAEPMRTNLYDSPSKGRPAIGSIEPPRNCQILVRAWVTRDNPSDFLSYPEILKDHLDYLREGWDGRVWDTPGAIGTAKPVPSRWTSYLNRNIPIDSLGSRRIGTEWWIHVRLLTESCGQSLEGVSPLAGWVPAYRRSGAPSAWFYSRGC